VNNQVPEGSGENNNVSTPTVFSIDRRQPDLLVTSVVVPVGLVKVCPVSFPVTWIVENQGSLSHRLHGTIA